MLNRRILRAKAMQSLYAYYQAKYADYQVCIQELSQFFQPDLNSMEEQDVEELAIHKSLAERVFKSQYKNPTVSFDAELPEAVKDAVLAKINTYHSNLAKDKVHYRKLMLKEIEHLNERFLKIIALPIELARLNENEQYQSDKKRLKSEESNARFNLANNRVIGDLKDDIKISSLLIKHDISWQGEREELKGWYKNILKKDEQYLAYTEKSNPDAEADWEITNHIFRQIILQNEELDAHFELWDINWAEDKEIIKSLLKKTLKSYQPEETEKFETFELSLNWEDDKAYFEDLYDLTIKNADQYDEIIAEKSKNWDIERISLLDKIILEMAIAEMINFPSIPVKVTINEYIELSKKYSTPKSKQFVNGVLDVLSVELKDQGLIKKSGRGLIDNQ